MIMIFFVCVFYVMCSGEYNVFDVTLSVYPENYSTVPKYHALEPEHWTSIPKVAGSIPTVVRQTIQLVRCGYTLGVIL
jgi:hypothetical protein